MISFWNPHKETPHGYPIISSRPSINGGWLIIAKREDHPVHPFVVWRQDERGVCEGGDYCHTLEEAQAARTRRH